MGVALLNTIAVSASTHYAMTHDSSLEHSMTAATLHGYAVAFWWAAGLFGVGALVTFIMLESGVPEFEGDLVPLL